MNDFFTPHWHHIISRFPHKHALSDTVRQLTYTELNNEALKLTCWLTEKGISGKCVIIRMENRMDSIIAILGILLSGNHYFYLSEEACQKADQYLPYLEVGAVITDQPDADLGTSAALLQWESLAATKPKLFPLPEVDSNTPFAVFTTSGSTGQPKLVRHRHGFMVAEFLSQLSRWHINSSDIRDYTGSLMFSASLNAIFPVFLSGAKLVVYSLSEEGILSLPSFWMREHITFTSVPVSLLRVLAKSGNSLEKLTSMKFMIVSAEAASYDDMKLFAGKLPGHVVLMHGYSTTETRGIAQMMHRLDNVDNNALGTVGKPVPLRTVYIQDFAGNQLPAGEIGEIVVEAKGLPERYLNDLSDASSSFAKMPSGNGLFRTGDLGYFTPQGYLKVVGRKDAIVKINGRKVNLQETEYCIAHYPEVRQAAVLLKENQRIQAFLSVTDRFDLQGLKREVARQLPPENIPAGWHVLPELPRTLTGKVDRKALPALLAPSKGEISGSRQENSLLETIQAVWKQELDLDSEVLPDQDFFNDLGGNSLLCAICLHELEKILGIALPVSVGYTYTTASALAAFISHHRDKVVLKIPLNTHSPSRPSLYFIPPYPGDRRTYHPLEHGLSDRYNLFFLYYNPLPPDSPLVPLDKLTDALVQQMEDGGEIHLLGYSFGGIMAYFIALKLEALQKPFRRLILLDTPLYLKYAASEKVMNIVGKTLKKLRQPAVSSVRLWHSGGRRQLFHSFRKYIESSFTPPKNEDAPIQPDEVIWQYTYSFPKHREIKADILLFKVEETLISARFRPDYSWNRFTKGRFKRVELAGRHDILFHIPENIKVLLETIVNL